MDAAEKHKPKPGLFDQILPPRLEDAGLEDCALPPDSIQEAFFRAASAVKSRATALLSPSDDGDDFDDPWSPTSGLSTDVVTGIFPERDAPAACATQKGLKLPDFGRDEVVVGGMEERRGKACVVDGLEGLEIEGQKSKEEENSGEKERPILGEGFA